MNKKQPISLLLIAVALITILSFSSIANASPPITDTVGGTSGSIFMAGHYIRGVRVTASGNGILQSLGVNVQTAAGAIRLSIYNSITNAPHNLLNESSSVTAVSGWNDPVVTGPTIVLGADYWLFLQASDSNAKVYDSSIGTAMSSYNTYTYGPFPNIFPSPVSSPYIINMRMTYVAPPTATTQTTTQTVISSTTQTVTSPTTQTQTVFQPTTVNQTVTQSAVNTTITEISPTTVSQTITESTTTSTTQTVNQTSFSTVIVTQTTTQTQNQTKVVIVVVASTTNQTVTVTV